MAVQQARKIHAKNFISIINLVGATVKNQA
jgi:hypothetical protein